MIEGYVVGVLIVILHRMEVFVAVGFRVLYAEEVKLRLGDCASLVFFYAYPLPVLYGVLLVALYIGRVEGHLLVCLHHVAVAVEAALYVRLGAVSGHGRQTLGIGMAVHELLGV